MNQELTNRIAHAVNCESRESVSDTLDSILASYLVQRLASYEAAVNARDIWRGTSTSAKLNQDLRTLKAFLEKEALDYVKFVNEMQARRNVDCDTDYRGLSGIEETKYWPFIQITDTAIAAMK